MLNAENNQRVYYWDNIKGILMFFVVFGHAIMPYISTQPLAFFIFQGIYFFHMPAFVFVSGYFISAVSDNRKSIIKLLFAYFIFNYLMMLYAGYVQGFSFQFLEPYYSYWYLLALIVWRSMGTAILDKWWMFPLSIGLAIVVGFWNDINNTLAVSRIIGFFPFYIAGYKVSKIDFKKTLNKEDSFINIVWGLLGIAILFIINIYLNELTFSDLVWHPYDSPIGALNRIVMTLTAFFMIIYFLKVTPEKKIPWISVWGKNSLAVLVLHRYVLFGLAYVFALVDVSRFFYPTLIIMSITTMFATGNDRVGAAFNNFLNYLYEKIFGAKHERSPKVIFTFVTFALIVLVIPVLSHTNLGLDIQEERNYFHASSGDIIHPVLTDEQLESINSAISIAFVGDLILLQDQVREAWCSSEQEHNFDPVFEYAEPYLQQADYAIGVLEGPLAGKEAGYSTSNYDDGIPMYLNFPDSFAEAIVRSGINLVTLANNHLLDKDVEGAMRTIDYLDQITLDYTGSYRNQQEKETTKIIEMKGLKLAVLSYTFPSNYYTEKYFFEENPTITSILVDKNSPYFKQARDQVVADFTKAREEKPDFIVVLPHMGTQFIHETDQFQDLWNDIFIDNGADIILTAHSHAVQPIEFRTVEKNDKSKTAIIVNCPGNFVNSYVDYNGDATSIVKVYLDPHDKSVVCASVVPMWTHVPVDGVHRALPIYDVLNDPVLNNQISRFEMDRIDEVQKLITSVMLEAEIPLHQAQDQYYLFPEGYHRQKVPELHLTNNMKSSEFYKLLEGGKKVNFVGDSITEGSRNGGYGWFEPLAETIEGLSYTKNAWPGATTLTLLNSIDEISSPETDVYVIAIGINDIRYRDDRNCAMTAEEYVENLEQLSTYINKVNKDADLVFISAWPVLPQDPYSPLTPEQTRALIKDYSSKLSEFCFENNYLFVNPGSHIENVLNMEVTSHYLTDHIHPNAAAGVKLYSESVLKD